MFQPALPLRLTRKTLYLSGKKIPKMSKDMIFLPHVGNPILISWFHYRHRGSIQVIRVLMGKHWGAAEYTLTCNAHPQHGSAWLGSQLLQISGPAPYWCMQKAEDAGPSTQVPASPVGGLNGVLGSRLKLACPSLWWASGEWTRGWKKCVYVCLSLPLCHYNFQINNYASSLPHLLSTYSFLYLLL